MGSVLVTGGAGYVAAPLVHRLVRSGHRVIVLDDLSRGHRDVVPDEAQLIVARVGDRETVRRILADGDLVGVFHFAARSLVGESVQDPLLYYQGNAVEGLALIEEIARHAPALPFVLSSSAAVYGVPRAVPIEEDDPKDPESPYGETKLLLERALSWSARAYGLRWAALRYFNAAGAEQGLRERHDPETHLIPNVFQAQTSGQPFTVFGDDYDTEDGTAVRDYIHVSDLAQGHLQALRHLQGGGESGAFNLGSGEGASVLEVVRAVERVTGRSVPFSIGARRAGDPPVLVASIDKARRVLEFEPQHSRLSDIVADVFREEQRK